eukprot:UN07143
MKKIKKIINVKSTVYIPYSYQLSLQNTFYYSYIWFIKYCINWYFSNQTNIKKLYGTKLKYIIKSSFIKYLTK